MLREAEVETVVVGGGIVGLAVARERLLRHPREKVVVLEKEPEVAAHQTGHNSGVLHSGIYYAPGSLKARTCREGRAAMEAFCEAEDLPLRRCGKVIVAVEAHEEPGLEALCARGRENGVDCVLVDRDGLSELEPHVAGRRAIHVRDAGVVDFKAVSRRLAERIAEAGGEVITSVRATGLSAEGGRVVVATDQGELVARRVVNCAGLQSDRVARLGGAAPDVRIVPFRGEYRLLRPEARDRVRALVYPVPDPRFPFLGVHLTRTLSDEVKAGPNAVLALRREGYRRRDVSLGDLWETLAWPGMRKLMWRYWRMGLAEMWRSVSLSAFTRSVRRLLPDLTPDDLLPGPTGVRAQALGRDGRMLDDFVLRPEGRVLHVLNAPSPAATASLAIARAVVDALEA